METLLSVIIGLGLSASCGFRIFVPLLVMNIAAWSGHLTLSQGFEWIGSYYALVAFATATTIEILAYYVPWLDNFLDAIAAPAAVIAGTVVTASVIGDMPPFLRWTLAVIAGGGIAGIVQGATVSLRASSTATTGGAGNFLVSTGELVGSTITAILAIFVPILSVILVAVISILIFRRTSLFSWWKG